jgi:tetratricopeptide (TPR) repeat protein
MPQRPSYNLKKRIDRIRGRLEKDPLNSDLFQQLGKAYLKSGALDEAEAAYRRSLELMPEDPWTHLYLGNLHYARQQYEQALSEFVLGRNLAPDLGISYVCIADAYACLGRSVMAGKYYRKAVSVDPHDETVQKNLRRWILFTNSSDEGDA